MLGRPPYWWRQGEICESVRDFPVTLVPAGNSVGKSFCAAGVILWFLHTFKGAKVVCTAPSQTQLEEVLWAEVANAHKNSRIPLAGKIYRSPLKIDKGKDGVLLAYSTTKTERLSGHHAVHLLCVVDEGSGIEPEIWEAVDSLNPSRLLVPGNPLRPYGQFYERCNRARNERSPLVNLITIPSTDSPDIDKPRSGRGLADRTWLDKARNDYGEGSMWWKAHVLAQFPDDATDQVFKREWIDQAFKTIHQRGGKPRTAIDLGLGNGGDPSVVMTKDDNGILACEASNTWTLEQTARRAQIQVARFHVEDARVSFDSEGIGADFDNRLRAAGIVGARPYRGGAEGNSKFTNLRSAAAWAARHRLDPTRRTTSPSGVMLPQVPFSLMAVTDQSAARLKKELRELRYTLPGGGKTALEKAEDYAKRLKHSPDFQATFCQLFGFDR